MSRGAWYKVTGDWKVVNEIHRKNFSGTWKEITEAYYKVAGAWKQVYPAPPGFDFTFLQEYPAETNIATVFGEGSLATSAGFTQDEWDRWTDNGDTHLAFNDTTAIPQIAAGTCAATGSGLVVVVEQGYGAIVVLNLDGINPVIVDYASVGVTSNLLACEDGNVYAIADGWLIKVNSAGVISQHANLAALSADLYLCNYSADYIWLYYSGDGTAERIDVLDGSTAETATWTAGREYLALAGDSSVFSLDVSAGGVPSRVYRNDVLVWTGADTTGYARNIMRDWATGDILVAEGSTLVRISESGASVTETTTNESPAIAFSAVDTNPTFPDTVAYYTTNERGAGEYVAMVVL